MKDGIIERNKKYFRILLFTRIGQPIHIINFSTID